MGLSLNGSSQYVSRTANLPAFSGFTICGWTVQASDPNANVGICGLNNSGDTGCNLLTQSDGTTLNIWNGSSDTGFSASPAVGTAYFFALTGDSGGIVGYWRAHGSNTFTTLSVSNATSGSPSNMHLGTYFTSFAQFMYPGRFWNVKIWDRKLTSAELMVESFFARPMYPASINLWWKLKNAADTSDYSGNGRTATFFNTPTVIDEPVNLWAVRRRIFSVAAAGGGTTISAGVDALVIAEQAAAVKLSRNVAAAVDTLVLAEQAAVTKVSRNVSASADALAIAEQAATVNRGQVIAAAADALSITEQAATIRLAKAIAAALDTLTLTEFSAAVSNGLSIQAQADALTIAEQSATLRLDRLISASTDVLVLAEHAASTKVSRNVAAAADALSITEGQAAIALGTTINAAIDTLTITEFAALVEGQQAVIEVVAQRIVRVSARNSTITVAPRGSVSVH